MCIVGPRNVSQHSSLLHNDTSPSSAKPMIKSQFDAVTIEIVFCPAHFLFKIFIFSNLFENFVLNYPVIDSYFLHKFVFFLIGSQLETHSCEIYT